MMKKEEGENHIMNREEIVRGVTDYFRSDHWRRLVAAIQDPYPQFAHLHSRVDTCVHPENVKELMWGYFEMKGWPIARKIDYVSMCHFDKLPPGWDHSPNEEMGSIHAVEPLGKVHFDYGWFYKPDVILAPTEHLAWGTSNLMFWNRWYVEEFYQDFQFRPVTWTEEKAIRAFFESPYWKTWLDDVVMDPNTTHTHMNVFTSIHPSTVARYAIEALNKKGWEVHYACPNVYITQGRYTGKVVFMGKRPDEVFDLSWRFKPDVIIEPARQNWLVPGDTGYDVFTKAMLEPIMSKPYVRLDPAEISGVLSDLRRRRP